MPRSAPQPFRASPWGMTDPRQTDTADASRPAESGQLSESARSRTTDPNAPQQADHTGAESGKHGRPTDDADPGHS